MITVYGLKSCDRCREARRWLAAEGVEFAFHDIRADGLPRETLRLWIETAGAETLLNRRSTTWRALPGDVKQDLSPAAAEALMLAYPTLVKRPVIDRGGEIVVGFDARTFAEKLD